MAQRKTANIAAKKLLKIDTAERYCRQPQELEDRAKEVVPYLYLEQEPTVKEWLRSLAPTKRGMVNYIRGVFPSSMWIPRYNWRWLLGDAIAGLTIGFVVVPQAMAYALLAGLAPEYGLYTSFVGAALYWPFGTSKDIVIGTTAVGSLLVGSVITSVEAQRGDMYTREDIAKTLSIVAGSILLFLGLFRLGWIIEFIPYVPISAFVTAASITIIGTQFPVAMGITGINTRDPPYLVIINTLKRLGSTKIDATIGLSSIALLFVIRDVCARMEVRQPSRKRIWATISSLRLTFSMLLYTMIGWLVNRDLAPGEQTKFRLVGTIEPGFKHAGFPKTNRDLVTLVLPELPAILIILVIEHIAIAKSFGRQFGYTVVPSQEIIAQGASNLLGTFVGGYVCTGSFGASAVLSKAGVRTPFAGVFGAMMLILALYALTAMFYYIPKAALAGLIIHAVSNLMTPPKALYKYWQLSPLELLIWIVGVVLALFTSLEVSIYTTISLSLVLVLVRIARTKGRFLGRVRIYRLTTDGKREEVDAPDESPNPSTAAALGNHREVFIPIDRQDSSNPAVSVESPHPGIFVYRFTEGFNYINQAQHMSLLQAYIISHTRRTKTEEGITASDRLWTLPDPLKLVAPEQAKLPILKALVLDFSAVDHVDITSVQGLLDLRNVLDAHAAPEVVEWHIAGVYNSWTRRALAVAGFGYPAADQPEALGKWVPVYAVASSLAGATADEFRAGRTRGDQARQKDCEGRSSGAEVCTTMETENSSETDLQRGVEPSEKVLQPLHGIDRPFFHVDIIEAVDAAIRDAMKTDSRKDEVAK